MDNTIHAIHAQKPESLAAVQAGETQELLSLLQHLVRGLLTLGRRLICFIDGLHLLEETKPEDFRLLMNCFQQLVDERAAINYGPSVKFVLTWPQPWEAQLGYGQVRFSVSNDMIEENELMLRESNTASPQDIDNILHRRSEPPRDHRDVLNDFWQQC